MSEKNGAFDLNLKPLEDLIKALELASPSARVGILGDKSQRPSDKGEQSNADIGVAHEFGTETLPVRSFLRVPITTQMQKYLNESNFFGSDSLKLIISEKSLMEWVRKIGIIAETIVGDSFENGGFGTWKPSNMDGKKIKQTLVETTQLRDSITSEVK